jgi:hypothetical protein
MNSKISVLLKSEEKKMATPSFSKNTPNKIRNSINVSEKNTLNKTDDRIWGVAIADEPIDAKVDGKKLFCVRVDDSGVVSHIMIGFSPMEMFGSKKEAYFGGNGFTGCGMSLYDGNLYYPVDQYHNIIDKKISKFAKEIIVVLTISNNGTKKEIRFLCDGKESKTSDVSEFKGEFLFPAICLFHKDQQITTIPIDQIKTRTPEIENLIKEYQEQQHQNGSSFLRFVSTSDFFLQKYPLLHQHEELGRKFLQQREVLFRGLIARMKLEIEAKQ